MPFFLKRRREREKKWEKQARKEKNKKGGEQNFFYSGEFDWRERGGRGNFNCWEMEQWFFTLLSPAFLKLSVLLEMGNCC